MFFSRDDAFHLSPSVVVNDSDVDIDIVGVVVFDDFDPFDVFLFGVSVGVPSAFLLTFLT